MIAKLRKWQSEQPEKVAAALYVEANVILTESKRRVPVDDGTLRASGRVDLERDGNRTKAIISYGGAANDYAIAVHEHLSSHSPPSWVAAGQGGINWSVPGTGPKYLEGPLNEALPDLLERLGKRLKL
jgi:hypothetical protein